jgi:hypothetical protein
MPSLGISGMWPDFPRSPAYGCDRNDRGFAGDPAGSITTTTGFPASLIINAASQGAEPGLLGNGGGEIAATGVDSVAAASVSVSRLDLHIGGADHLPACRAPGNMVGV